MKRNLRFLTAFLGLGALVGGLGLSSCTGGESSLPSEQLPTAGIVGQASLAVGETVSYGLEVDNIVSGSEIAWSSSDPSIFTVTEDGEATGVAVGNATLSASVGGASASLDITVIPAEAQTFDVRFENYDGTLLYQTKVKSGEKATYMGKEPERTSDYQNVYVFTGWDKDPEETIITEDTTFTARFGVSDGSGFVFNKITANEYQLTAYVGNPFDYAGHVTVPSTYAGDPITAIGASAFSSNSYASNILWITINEGVTSIGDECFYGLTSLQRIEMPDSAYDLGEDLFRGCVALTSVSFPSSAESVPDYAFYGCSKLSEIKLSDDITSIGDSSFYGCTSLASINLPDSIASMDYRAFYGCTALKSIHIPDSLVTLGGNGDNEGYAFHGCTSLATITGMKNLKHVGSHAFFGCSLLKTLPVSMEQFETIGEFAFAESAISEVTFAESMLINDETLSSEADGYSPTRGLYLNAFRDCFNLSKVTYGSQMVAIPRSLFYGCYQLSEENVSGFTSVTRIDGNAFQYCGFKTLDMTSLFPKVQEIGMYAFSEFFSESRYGEDGYQVDLETRRQIASLTSLTIPNTVATLGTGCFSSNYKLETVVFASGNPNTISLSSSTFSGCTSLKSVNWGGNSVSDNFSFTMFDGCTSMESFDVPSNFSSQYSSDEEGVLFNSDKTILYSYPLGRAETTYAMPGSVVAIDTLTNPKGFGFKGASKLTSITMSSSLESINQSRAFAECTSLTSLTFPASLKNLDYAYYLCLGDTALETATFNTTALHNLPSYTFSECTALKSVTLGQGQVNIQTLAFDGCTALSDVYIYGDGSEDYGKPNLSAGAFCDYANWTNNQMTSTSNTFSGLTIHWNGTKESWKAGTFSHSDGIPALEIGIKVECTDGTMKLDSITWSRTSAYDELYDEYVYYYSTSPTYVWEDLA